MDDGGTAPPTAWTRDSISLTLNALEVNDNTFRMLSRTLPGGRRVGFAAIFVMIDVGTS